MVRMCEATRHPTMVREKASMMKQTSAKSVQVGTNVGSVTHNRSGAVAVTSRRIRSG